MMSSQSPHPVTSPVVRNGRSRQNQQKRCPSGQSQLPPTERRVSVPAGERDPSQGGSSVASTIQGQNSTPSSSLNNSRVADITPSATQRQSIITPTATPGTSSRNTPASSGTSQTDSTRATARDQRRSQWQLQMQAVSTPRSVVSGSHIIHRFGHSDMTRLIFSTGRLLELYMWNKRPFISASDLETGSYATRCIAKASAEAPHW